MKSILLLVLVAIGLLAACASSSSDADPNAACNGKPVPEHACIGGKREPRCTSVDGDARWKIDCLRGVTETAPLGNAISQCQPGACGPEPARDNPDCMHASAPPDCSNVDRRGCAWRRPCLPKPCEAGAPGCNTLVASEIGPPCNLDMDAGSGRACVEGSCVTITPNAGEATIGPVCVKDPCKALVCAEGTTCAILTSYPGQVVCGH